MTTQTVWNFTPDEFAWVWGETGLDEYPDPISVIESPTTRAEYARLAAEIGRRYPRHGNPDLTGPLRVLAHPDLRIVCTGRALSSHKRVRSVAAAVADLGVVLFQKSGSTADFGGDLKLVVTQRAHLGRHIAATMPVAPAGAAGQLTGYTPRVRRPDQQSSWLRSDTGDPAEERIRALLQAPRNAEGYLRIDRIPDDRPQPPTYLPWIDIRDEHPAAGRYLFDVDADDTRVLPADPETIARELNQRTTHHLRAEHTHSERFDH